MAGLKPIFTMQAVEQYMQNSIDAYEQKVIEALQSEGERFATAAKEKLPKDGSFKDRTANLRSSIGYVILKNGEVVDSVFEGKGSEGVSEGQRIATEIGAQYPKGFILIGVAGMNYAAAVESKGYDVITGSAPEDQQIKDILGAISI